MIHVSVTSFIFPFSVKNITLMFFFFHILVLHLIVEVTLQLFKIFTTMFTGVNRKQGINSIKG